MKENLNIQCWFDGCCEPTNPGGAMGAGAFILIDGKQKMIYSFFTQPSPVNSNNVAEYKAFEAVLNYLIENRYTDHNITIYGDSKLVICQMLGTWRILSGLYVPAAKRCKEKVTMLNKIKLSLQWIPRHKNEYADTLSKQELKKNGIQFKIQPEEKIR